MVADESARVRGGGRKCVWAETINRTVCARAKKKKCAGMCAAGEVGDGPGGRQDLRVAAAAVALRFTIAP